MTYAITQHSNDFLLPSVDISTRVRTIKHLRSTSNSRTLQIRVRGNRNKDCFRLKVYTRREYSYSTFHRDKTLNTE